MKLSELYELWDELGDTPVTEYGKIEEPFLHFPVSTDREDIWRWFEAQNPYFIVGNVMQGIRPPDEEDAS